MSFWRIHINHFLKIVLAVLMLSLLPYRGFVLFAQGPCSPSTPVFNVDLTGNPNGTWVSSAVPRAGNCCGTSSPYRCIEFIITLDPAAVAINFQIVSGAVPPGAMFYQIGCGTPTAVGTPICLNGPGPFTLTFCKPGNNINTYSITSIGKPLVSPGDTVGFGCNITLAATGFVVNSSLTWNSIYPGTAGNYNSYLSCTSSCLSTVVTSGPGLPSYVDYQVCGTPLAGACASSGLSCDTSRVYFSPPLVSSINPNPASFCSNNNSGVMLTGNASGGEPPYNYTWTNPSGSVLGTGLTYTALAAGSYNFIVHDRNYPDCPGPISTVVVTVSPPPVINAGPDKMICDTFVLLNGTVTGASGGTWTGGNGVFIPGNTSANSTYIPTPAERTNGTLILTYTSTGNGGCSAVSDQVVISIPPPVHVLISGAPVICYGQTAAISANATGGIPPYTYQWSNGATTQTISNLSTGTYSVTITDASPGHCGNTASKIITQNPQIIVTTSLDSAIACNTTAFISATATGGAGTLTYLWSNGATTHSTSVNSGTYSITVTDALGCSAAGTIIISPSNSTLSATINQPGILCNGTTTMLTTTATGGIGSYSYAWNTGAVTQSIVAGAGNKCVTVTDAAGCIAMACVIVTENSAINVSIPTPSLICSGASTAVNANATGGQTPYNYLWNTGETDQSITKSAGTYTVTVSDAANCTNTASVIIIQEPAINISMSSIDVACFGGNTGSATATVTGGTAPYLYSWLSYGGASAATNGLLAGTYTVNVTDNTGCTKTSTTLIAQPSSALSASITNLSDVSCNGGNNGAAIVNAVGGTSPYLYSWSPGGGTSQSPANLSAGSYTVTITDFKGCTQTAQTIITEPPLLIANVVSATPVSCNGGNTGSASVSASGGTPGYTYLWAPGGGTNANANNLAAGTYTVTITDLKSCAKQLNPIINQPSALSSTISGNNISCNGGNNGTATVTPSGGTSPYLYSWTTSPVQTNATAINLIPGTYTVTVTDSRACTTTNNFPITQPPLLTVTTSPPSSVVCNATATISASASGGTGSSTYLWNTGQTTPSIVVHAGTYNITVTDGSGCTATGSVIIGSSNSTLAASINQPSNICHGSVTTITATASNGSGTYTYLWNTGLTASSISVGAGNYCVTVTDGAGCIATACVTINQNSTVIASINSAPIICSGATTTIGAVGSGGQAPYNYLWSNGATTQTIIQPAGSYTVTISDITGSTCFATNNVSIIAATPINSVMNSTDVSCFGANNGSALVYASGGLPGYSYSWAPSGNTTAYAGNLSPGLQTVTITDTMGCIKTGSVIIIQPSAPVSITLATTNNLCFGDSIGTAAATGHGGSSPYYYFWTANGDSTTTITGLKAGVYDVVVADNTGCYTNVLATVTQPSDIVLSGSTVASTCSSNNGSATVTGSGGTGALTYAWTTSPVQTNATASNLPGGNYSITVTDVNGCHKSLPLTVGAASFLNPNFYATTGCLKTATLFTDSSSSSPGSSITAWAWDFGNFIPIDHNQNPTYTYTSPGVYSVSLTVTSSIGCVSTITKPVSFYNLPTANFYVVNACSNALTQFSDSSMVTADSINSWVWNFGDANASATTQNSGHTYNPAGVYNVSLIVSTNHGCIDTIVKTIKVYPVPVVEFTVIDTSGCAPICSQFIDTTVPVGDTISSWLWNFGDASPSATNSSLEHCYSVPGAYTISLTATTLHGCSSTKTKMNHLNVFPIPVAAFNYAPQPGSTDAPEIYFDNLSVGSSAWSWNFGDAHDQTESNLEFPTHRYSDSGHYCPRLIVQNTHFCFDTVAHCLEINAEFTFYIPNAFTPEGDGNNDQFAGFGTFIKQYDMWIFDRWGNMIFHTDELGKGWDGKANHGTEISQRDVYVYLVELKDFKGHKHSYRGIVTLVR